MAYSKDDFLRDLAIYSTGAAIGPKNTAKFFAYAGKKGIQLAGIGASRAAVPAARGIGAIVRRNPYAFAGLTLYEAERRGLLDEPKERIRDTAIEAFERGFDYLPQQTPQEMLEAMQRDQGIKRPKKPSKYNRSVKAGMAAIKASSYFGKKGTLSSPKKAFAAVNRTASKVNKGKKVSNKGAIGKIARAVRRILK